jgi:hypothetical protein
MVPMYIAHAIEKFFPFVVVPREPLHCMTNDTHALQCVSDIVVAVEHKIVHCDISGELL